MENQQEQLEETMETILYRLDAIYSMIDSSISGMKAEQLPEQAISCMECIQYCIHDLKIYVNESIKQAKRM